MVQKWRSRKLGEICDIYQPQTITSNEIVKEGPFKVFGANGVIGYYTKYNHEDAEVLVTCRGATCGTLNMSEPKSWITGNAMVVHPKDGKVLSRDFLYYTLKNFNLSRTITGTGQPQITRNSLSPFQIPLPPLEIQKQIVERLDKIVEAQKLNDDLIQKTDELFQSLLHKELNLAGKDWEVKKLGDIAEVIMGQSPPSSSYNEQGEGLPFFQGKAEFGEMYPTPVKYCPSPTRIAEAGDILMSVRAPVGNINLAKEKSGIGRGLGAIRAGKGVDQSFLYFFFLKNENNWSRLSVGSTFLAIRRSNLDNLKIPLPPLETQKQIVAKLSAVQEYKTGLIAQRTKLKELFNSALHKSMSNK